MSADYFDDIFDSDYEWNRSGLVTGTYLSMACGRLPRLRREVFPQLLAHVSGPPSGRVMVLAGAPSTSKTTLLLQAAAALPTALRATAAFVRRGWNLDCDGLSRLAAFGMTHVFIDHATDESEGPDLSMLSRFAGKMVLTLASRDTLFFRSVKEPGLEVLRVSHVPSRERMRLTGAAFPRCIRDGGPLDDGGEHPFYDWGCGRILKALARLGRGWERDLRVSSDENMQFENTLRFICRMPAVEAFRRIFPHDGSEYCEILAKAGRGCAEKEGIMRSHLRCLELEDILASCPEEDAEGRIGVRRLAVQSHYRFREMESSLKLDCFTRQDLQTVRRIVNDRLLLDLILLDTFKAAPPDVLVRSLLLPGNRRGMLVADRRRRRCALFLAADASPDPAQGQPLRDRRSIAGLARRFGAVVRRAVLCRDGGMEKDGIFWQDAAEYLSLLDDPAALDWLCGFTVPDAPAAPVNRSCRRPAAPPPARLRPMPEPRKFEHDPVFSEIRLGGSDLRRLLAGESEPVSLSAGRFLLRAAGHDAAAMELVEEHIGAAVLREAGLPAPSTRLGRCQGMTALLTQQEDRPFTPAPVPVLAGSGNAETQVRSMDEAAAWAARYGVEKSFWTLAGMDAFLGNHGRPRGAWGVSPADGDLWRLALPRGNLARLIHIPRGRNSVAHILLDALDVAIYTSTRRDEEMLQGLGRAARFLSWMKWQDESWINMKLLVGRIRRQRFITAAEEAWWREAMEEVVFHADFIAERIKHIEED